MRICNAKWRSKQVDFFAANLLQKFARGTQVGHHFVRRFERKCAFVAHGVNAHTMPLGHHTAHHIGTLRRLFANQKKGGVNAIFAQNVQNFRRLHRIAAIVESESHCPFVRFQAAHSAHINAQTQTVRRQKQERKDKQNSYDRQKKRHLQGAMCMAVGA